MIHPNQEGFTRLAIRYQESSLPKPKDRHRAGLDQASDDKAAFFAREIADDLLRNLFNRGKCPARGRSSNWWIWLNALL